MQFENSCCLICISTSTPLKIFKRCIDSLEIQTKKIDKYYLYFDGFEIVDEYDEYLVRLRNISEICIISNPIINGFTYGINFLLSISTEEIIFRMDIDDIALPVRFEVQKRYLQSNSNIDIVGSNIIEIYPNGNFFTKIMPEFHDQILKFALFRNPINHMTVAFRRSSFRAIGKYPNLKKKQDYAAWLMLMNEGKKFYNIQDNLVAVPIDDNFYLRRSGLDYALLELKLMYYKFRLFKLRKIVHILSITTIRMLIMILPNYSVRVIYKKLLR